MFDITGLAVADTYARSEGSVAHLYSKFHVRILSRVSRAGPMAEFAEGNDCQRTPGGNGRLHFLARDRTASDPAQHFYPFGLSGEICGSTY